jgi:hypothetical protein
VVEDVDVVVNTTEICLARTHGKDRHICQTVNTLVSAHWKSAIHDESSDCINVVDVVVVATEAGNVDGRYTWTILVNSVVLSVIWER